MNARFFIDMPLQPGALLRLPDAAARHVQVLRLQPGGRITLYNGEGHAGQAEGAFDAVVERMGRSDVDVMVGDFTASARETSRAVHLAVGMPTNERMDWLVEKATELGVAVIQPLMTERSVVRLDEERARKKTAHWISIAVSACEQCGRNRVPELRDVATLTSWSRQLGSMDARSASLRLVLSLRHGARPLQELLAGQRVEAGPVTVLSGPEGGLSAAEEELALQQGFVPVTLGPRILRAETAALAALTLLA